jgi:hypothetical protein
MANLRQESRIVLITFGVWPSGRAESDSAHGDRTSKSRRLVPIPGSQLSGNVCVFRMMGAKAGRSPHPETRSPAKEGGVVIIRMPVLRAQLLVGGSARPVGGLARQDPSRRIAGTQFSLPERPDDRPSDMQSLHPRQLRKNRAFAWGKGDDSKIQNRGSGSPRTQYDHGVDQPPARVCGPASAMTGGRLFSPPGQALLL